VLCGLFVWFDAVIPIFPGETTLSAASTLAARGDLNPWGAKTGSGEAQQLLRRR
jgi:membrane protein DedA with SNARE-associated domain